jgi:hypothetical protein
MVELYAWASIWGDEVQEDEHSCYADVMESLIRSKMNDLNLGVLFSGRIHLEFFNGGLTLSAVIKGNRFRQEHQDVFALLKYIAEIAKGSYGLIYLHDSENLDGKENVFRVFVLKNGALKEAEDPFLSPIFPDVEE